MPEVGRDRRRTAVLLVAAAAYSIGAAATAPFTLPADVMTAVPVCTLTVLAVARWPLRPGRGGRETTVRPDTARAGRAAHPWRAWVGLLAVVTTFELLEYFARGSRGAHPTLSSMADAVDRHGGLKALVFFGWLCLGAAILEAGSTREPDVPPGEERG